MRAWRRRAAIRRRPAGLAVVSIVALALSMLMPLLLRSAAASQACLTAGQTRDVWHRLPGPSTQGVSAFALSGESSCELFATDTGGSIFRTSDGGYSWTRTTSLGVPLAALQATALPPRTVIAGRAGAVGDPSAPSAFVSHDDGASFTAVQGVTGVQLSAATSAPSDVQTVALAGRPVAAATGLPGLPVGAGATTVFLSHDFGASYSPAPGSAGLSPAGIAFDPTNASTIWVASDGADHTTPGLFESVDAGVTFVQKLTTPVATYGVEADALPGGSVQIMAATASGLQRSTDATNWQTIGGPVAAAAFHTEWYHPLTGVVVDSTGRILRGNISSSRGLRTIQAGLPAGCRPDALDRDSSDPSMFLVRCTDGSAYTYRSDGSDISGADNTDPNLPSVPPAKTLPMPILRQLPMPAVPDRDQSAALAFDGRHLLFADEDTPGAIYLMSPVTGAYQGVYELAGPTLIALVAYDDVRDLVYAYDTRGNIYSYDPRRRATKYLFHSPVYSSSPPSFSVGSMTFDASADRFRFSADQGQQVIDTDRTGKVVAECSPPFVAANTSTDQIVDPGDEIPGVAALASSGDGQLYLEMEDDKTVYRVDHGCNVIATYSHRTYSEATDENDQMACDTLTFGQPAVWIRDATAGVIAYQVPNGYCPMATHLSVSSVASLAGVATRLCAKLTASEDTAPVPAQPVDLLTAGVLAGRATTDAAGLACVTTRAPRPPSVGSTRRPRATVATTRAVEAVFLGNASYRASSAFGSWQIKVAAAPPVQPPAVVPPVPAVIVAAVPPPPPPPPAPPAVPKPQPLPQAHPGAQPGAVGQPGVGFDQEEEVESAAEHADVSNADAADVPEAHQFSALSTAEPTLIGLLAFGLGAAGLEMRRRRSRVREQGAT